MEQIECSEMSAYKIQTPGNYPEENIQHDTANCTYLIVFLFMHFLKSKGRVCKEWDGHWLNRYIRIVYIYCTHPIHLLHSPYTFTALTLYIYSTHPIHLLHSPHTFTALTLYIYSTHPIHLLHTPYTFTPLTPYIYCTHPIHLLPSPPYIYCTHSIHLLHSPHTFTALTLYIYSTHPIHLLHTPYTFTPLTQCIYSTHPIHLLHSLYTSTPFTPCIYSTHSIHLLCCIQAWSRWRAYRGFCSLQGRSSNLGQVEVKVAYSSNNSPYWINVGVLLCESEWVTTRWRLGRVVIYP